MYSLNKDYDKVYLGDKQLLTGNIYLGDVLINTLQKYKYYPFKKWRYDVGDVIVYDKNKETKYAIDPNKLSEISPDDYEAIGVVAIPSSHDVYGTKEAGVIALKFNNHYTPDSGGEAVSTVWGHQYNNIGNNTQIGGLGRTNNYPIDTLLSETITEGYLPTEYGEGITSMYELKYDSSLPNSNSSQTYIPSPYNDNGTKNSLYEKSIEGFKGKEKSKMLIQAYDKEGWKTAQGTPGIQEESHIEIVQTPETLNIRHEYLENYPWEISNNSDSINGFAYTSLGYNQDSSYAIIRFYFNGQPGDKVVIVGRVNNSENWDNSLLTLGLDRRGKDWIYLTKENPSIVVELPDSNEHFIEMRANLSYSEPDKTATFYITKSPTPYKVIDVPYQAAKPAFQKDSYWGDNIPVPFLCSWRFHTNGTSQGDWYIPSIGELGYVISKLITINSSLQAIQTWDNTSNPQLFSYTSTSLIACSETNSKYVNWGYGGSYFSYGISTNNSLVQTYYRSDKQWISRSFTRIKPNEL